MNYKLYKTPGLGFRTDKSERCYKNIANLLLSDEINQTEGVNKLVTVPAENASGFNVVACQASFRNFGNAAYVFLAEPEQIYQFREAILPIRNLTRRFLKAGLKGLLLGAEEKGFVEKIFYTGNEEKDEMEQELIRSLFFQHGNPENYHFIGTVDIILDELRKKCSPIRR